MAVVVFHAHVLAPGLTQAAVWERRDPAFPSSAPTDLERRDAAFWNAPPIDLRIPSSQGQIIEQFNGRPDQPRIIHIQDAHQHAVGQWQIARMLQRLAQRPTPNAWDQERSPPLTVCLEGASGPLEIGWLARLPDTPAKRQVAAALLRQGELHGEEYAALMLPPLRSFDPSTPLGMVSLSNHAAQDKLHSGQAGRLRFVGVDDPDLYRAHAAVKAMVERRRGMALQRLATIEGSLAHHSPLLHLQRQLWSLTLTSSDYAEYLRLQQQGTPHPPLPQGERGNSPLASPQEGEAKPPEAFYALAKRRDEALVRNTLHAAHTAETREVVLIAGGFHTPGLTRFLRRHGVSYVVVQPRLTSSALPPHPGVVIDTSSHADQAAFMSPVESPGQTRDFTSDPSTGGRNPERRRGAATLREPPHLLTHPGNLIPTRGEADRQTTFGLFLLSVALETVLRHVLQTPPEPRTFLKNTALQQALRDTLGQATPEVLPILQCFPPQIRERLRFGYTTHWPPHGQRSSVHRRPSIAWILSLDHPGNPRGMAVVGSRDGGDRLMTLTLLHVPNAGPATTPRAGMTLGWPLLLLGSMTWWFLPCLTAAMHAGWFFLATARPSPEKLPVAWIGDYKTDGAIVHRDLMALENGPETVQFNRAVDDPTNLERREPITSVPVYGTVRFKRPMQWSDFLVRFRYGTPINSFSQITYAVTLQNVYDDEHQREVWSAENDGTAPNDAVGTSFRVQTTIPLRREDTHWIEFQMEVADPNNFPHDFQPEATPPDQEQLWSSVGEEQGKLSQTLRAHGLISIATSPAEEQRLRYLKQIEHVVRTIDVETAGFLRSVIEEWSHADPATAVILPSLQEALRTLEAGARIMRRFGILVQAGSVPQELVEQVYHALLEGIHVALGFVDHAVTGFKRAHPEPTPPAAEQRTKELTISLEGLRKAKTLLAPQDHPMAPDSAAEAFNALAGKPIAGPVGTRTQEVTPRTYPAIDWPPPSPLLEISKEFLKAHSEAEVFQSLHEAMQMAGWGGIYIYSVNKDPKTQQALVKAERSTGQLFSSYRLPRPPTGGKQWVLEKLAYINHLRKTGQATPPLWWFYPVTNRDAHLMTPGQTTPTVVPAVGVHADDRFVEPAKYQRDQLMYDPRRVRKILYVLIGPEPDDPTAAIEPLGLMVLHIGDRQHGFNGSPEEEAINRRFLETIMKLAALALQRVRAMQRQKSSIAYLKGRSKILQGLAHDIPARFAAAGGWVRSLRDDLWGDQHLKDLEQMLTDSHATVLALLTQSRAQLSALQQHTEKTLRTVSTTKHLSESQPQMPLLEFSPSSEALVAHLVDRLSRASSAKQVEEAVRDVLRRTKDETLRHRLGEMGQLAWETEVSLESQRHEEVELRALHATFRSTVERLQQLEAAIGQQASAIDRHLSQPQDWHTTRDAIKQYGKTVDRLINAIRTAGDAAFIPTLEPVDLPHTLFPTVTGGLVRLARDHDVQFTWNIHDVPQREIVTDPYFVEQALHLIIENAIKYTAQRVRDQRDRGTVMTGKVTVNFSQEQGGDGLQTVFQVTDNGPGIRPDLLERIFEFSTRGDAEGTPGFGIGLGMARKYIEEALGGKVFVEHSKVGEGTTFRIELPAVPPSPTDLQAFTVVPPIGTEAWLLPLLAPLSLGAGVLVVLGLGVLWDSLRNRAFRWTTGMMWIPLFLIWWLGATPGGLTSLWLSAALPQAIRDTGKRLDAAVKALGGLQKPSIAPDEIQPTTLQAALKDFQQQLKDHAARFPDDTAALCEFVTDLIARFRGAERRARDTLFREYALREDPEMLEHAAQAERALDDAFKPVFETFQDALILLGPVRKGPSHSPAPGRSLSRAQPALSLPNGSRDSGQAGSRPGHPLALREGPAPGLLARQQTTRRGHIEVLETLSRMTSKDPALKDPKRRRDLLERLGQALVRIPLFPGQSHIGGPPRHSDDTLLTRLLTNPSALELTVELCLQRWQARLSHTQASTPRHPWYTGFKQRNPFYNGITLLKAALNHAAVGDTLKTQIVPIFVVYQVGDTLLHRVVGAFRDDAAKTRVLTTLHQTLQRPPPADLLSRLSQDLRAAYDTAWSKNRKPATVTIAVDPISVDLPSRVVTRLTPEVTRRLAALFTPPGWQFTKLLEKSAGERTTYRLQFHPQKIKKTRGIQAVVVPSALLGWDWPMVWLGVLSLLIWSILAASGVRTTTRSTWSEEFQSLDIVELSLPQVTPEPPNPSNLLARLNGERYRTQGLLLGT